MLQITLFDIKNFLKWVLDVCKNNYTYPYVQPLTTAAIVQALFSLGLAQLV